MYHVSAMKDYQLSERKVPDPNDDMQSYSPRCAPELMRCNVLPKERDGWSPAVES